ncbi:MAG: cytochrome c maturation protein CcmE [Bacillota bacterium]|nr:cytochrome c maturation protein CcmE [Bacillota bacterium]
MKNLKAYLLVAVFIAIAIWQGGSSIQRYATPADALARGGRVQVMGTLAESSEGHYVVGEAGDKVKLDNSSVKNLRLDPGQQVVAIGTVQDSAIFVERLLYKCPSKYEKGD